MMGLLFPVLLSGLGLGFEISNWYLRTRAMQNATAAAVIAAASNGEGNYNVEAAAVAAHYGFIDGADNVAVKASNNATCPSGTNINPPCYSVTISSIVPLFLFTTTFAYAPLFPGATVASMFTTPIVKTGMMRLN
jgi:Flp pilus assembly protein TadG